MTVGERVKVYALEHGVMFKFLAEKSGTTSSKMSLFLNGKRDIGIIEYYNICKALDVPMDTFIKEEA